MRKVNLYIAHRFHLRPFILRRKRRQKSNSISLLGYAVVQIKQIGQSERKKPLAGKISKFNMAACKGAINRIITKHFANIRVSPWLLQNNRPPFLLKVSHCSKIMNLTLFHQSSKDLFCNFSVNTEVLFQAETLEKTVKYQGHVNNTRNTRVLYIIVEDVTALMKLGKHNSQMANILKSQNRCQSVNHHNYYFNNIFTARELDELTFHTISDETLHVLLEYFEELGDLGYFDQDYDIEYSVRITNSSTVVRT